MHSKLRVIDFLLRLSVDADHVMDVVQRYARAEAELASSYARRPDFTEASILDMPVVWNKRLTTTAGRFKWDYIELSPRLYDEEGAQEQTFLHELAHAITPRARHGPKWKQAMVDLGQLPRVYHSYQALQTPTRVVAECLGCGHEVLGRRRKGWHWFDTRVCRKCRSRFAEVGPTRDPR